MSQSLITAEMLDDAAETLKGHKVRRGRCSCGSTTPSTASYQRHQAEVVAEAIAPALVADIMQLVTTVAKAAS